MTSIPGDITEFLGKPSPDRWLTGALGAVPVLLVDHANCEKKAAASALSLMFRYPQRSHLVDRMSRLAREELRHFEQVRKLMRDRGVPWLHVPASRYAAGLRAMVSPQEPARLIDLLVIGAFIEARSCERFALLAPRLDEPLGSFYAGLLASEARHFKHYLELARRYCGEPERDALDERVACIRKQENALITSPDDVIRFHSGPPA